jgi:hypothetical protein
MVGSATAANPRGAVEALLENPFTDLVYFYKNLNGSFTADEDDAYHVYSRRCRVRSTSTESCAVADLIFVTWSSPDGAGDGSSTSPSGAHGGEPGRDIAGGRAGESLRRAQRTGPVTVVDADDPRRDPSRAPDLAAEIAASLTSPRPIPRPRPASSATCAERACDVSHP